MLLLSLEVHPPSGAHNALYDRSKLSWVRVPPRTAFEHVLARLLGFV